MNNYLKIILLLLLFVPSCTKDENVKQFPSPEYPFTYRVLNKQELDSELLKFKAINTIESLSLDEYGILSGYIPITSNLELDSVTVKTNISLIINSYGHFLGIGNSTDPNISKDISILLIGGVEVSLGDYFKYGSKANPTFVLKQHTLGDTKTANIQVIFSFQKENNRMHISGRWYPEVYIPEIEIKSPDEALNISIQYIKEKHKDVTPLDVSNVEKDKFNKVLVPLHQKNKIELRECWEVIFWSNFIKTFVDTQTGEVISYLDYGHMI